LNKIITISLYFFISSLIITGCSTASSSFATKASQFDFQSLSIQGINFSHTIYENKYANQKNNDTFVLHVYLGGDGTPWFKKRYISNDPTPLNPVMLHLMKMDNSPAIYLGRPCYHQHRMPNECNNTLWTHKRYSSSIVDSMVFALKQYIRQKRNNNVKINIKLLGFSGGGTLAMLIAPHIQQVSTVVTLAGNLDIDRWASHHGYLPLTGSLNPAKQAPLSNTIQQFHLVGNEDKNAPTFISQPIFLMQKNAHYIIVKNADHHCCWASTWLSLLKKLNQSTKI